VRLRFAGSLLLAATLLAVAASGADPSSYAGIAGATLVDSGTLVVSGGGPFDRTEQFEFLRRPDGGYTLLNTMTATDGRYRAQARFDLDGDWNSQQAHGIGLYDGKAVAIAMQRRGKKIEIQVTPLERSVPDASRTTTAVCDPSCFINMSPSATAMFVMTRHYDFARGGEQEFQWAGQDLDRVRTLSGGKARLVFVGQKELAIASGERLRLRHFTFVESLPKPDGGVFNLHFDLWTDDVHRPMGFRVRSPGGAAPGVVAWRRGYEEIRSENLH